MVARTHGVVRFSNGDILIFVKEKNNQYKLPGGSKEGNETPEETFIREVHEETGYKIKNISKVGITKGYTQISHFFYRRTRRQARNTALR